MNRLGRWWRATNVVAWASCAAALLLSAAALLFALSDYDFTVLGIPAATAFLTLVFPVGLALLLAVVGRWQDAADRQSDLFD